MIRPLRVRHRRMITLLAVALIALFIAALVARKPAPVMPRIPEALIRIEGEKR
jgi:hypothetical protein